MRRALGTVLLLGVVTAATMVGCTAVTGGDASAAPSPTAAASSAAAPAPTPAPLPTPTSAPDQLAITFFDNSQTPSASGSIAGPAGLRGEFRIDGDCRGESFRFRLRDATPDAPERDLVSGEIVCGDPGSLPEFRYDLGADGTPVQLVIVDADRATQGWVRATRVN